MLDRDQEEIQMGEPAYLTDGGVNLGNNDVGFRDPKEVRTTSASGGQKGVKPQNYALIPVGPLATVAELYSVGAQKYDDHNWRNGYEWSKSYNALQRHANAFWNGEEMDQETGLPHMASVIFHAMALMEFAETHKTYDDRYCVSRSKAPYNEEIMEENLEVIKAKLEGRFK